MDGPTWPSALLAVVFSACKKELAENCCRPNTQNVAGHKELIRAMGQAIGGGVRKAEGDSKWYDCNWNPYPKNQGANLPFWRHVCVDSNTPWVLGERLPWRVVMLAVEFPKQSKREL